MLRIWRSWKKCAENEMNQMRAKSKLWEKTDALKNGRRSEKGPAWEREIETHASLINKQSRQRRSGLLATTWGAFVILGIDIISSQVDLHIPNRRMVIENEQGKVPPPSLPSPALQTRVCTSLHKKGRQPM